MAVGLGGEHDVSRHDPAVEQHGCGSGLPGSRPEAHAEKSQAAEHGEQRVAGLAGQATMITVYCQLQFERDGPLGERRPTVQRRFVVGMFAHREIASVARAPRICAKARRYSLEPRKSPIGWS